MVQAFPALPEDGVHEPEWSPVAAGRRNLWLLIQLRWLAVAGQLGTILFVELVMGAHLPLVPMGVVLGGLFALNIFSMVALRREVDNRELFGALLFDFGALTLQLYLSGGATNPFVSLYLVQVVLCAILLEAWASWALVGLTAIATGWLAVNYQPLALPPRFASLFSPVHLFGTWLNIVIAAVLLVAFVTRVAGNLRARDAHLAEMRQHATEEDHIVRMGLLASGAAHELGTPLASLSVILGDWQRMPLFAGRSDLAQEIEDMQAEVRRCKSIVTGILMSAGEPRGEAPARTTLRNFLTSLAEDWQAARPGLLRFEDHLGDDLAIVSDTALKQVIGNILDNAVGAAATAIRLVARREGGTLSLVVDDNGTGFVADVLAKVGKPYQTTKFKPGGGLGLFLATNVARTWGGRLTAENLSGGGARVRLVLPVAALALEEAHD